MGRESDRDVREEIRVALFWRALLGDYEYIKFDPDDMLRWYDALELRGPIEIRDYMDARYRTRPVSAVLGIVSAAPHPPTWIVREWLSHYEQKVQTRHLWLSAAGFMLASVIVFPLLYGCTTLRPVSMYVMNPPSSGVQPYAPPSVLGSNAEPAAMTPPTTFAPTQTGPQSGGIAGAALGVASPSGVTGQSNSGLSAGAGAPGAGAGGATGQP